MREELSEECTLNLRIMSGLVIRFCTILNGWFGQAADTSGTDIRIRGLMANANPDASMTKDRRPAVFLP
jgi:hypothetical protein